jgi:hypothetical protein
MDDKALLWHLYDDNRTQAQFHETQRVNGTGLIGSGAAVIIAVISQDGHYTRSEVPLAIVLIVIGAFGFLFCLKEYERMQLHLNRCRAFLKLLDDLDETHDLNAIKDECDKKTAAQFPMSSKLKLRIFWQGIHVIIALTGIAVLIRIHLTS